MNSIFTRVSTREFTDKKITDEEIKFILKAAMQAPSARNGQPWEFYVITNKEILNTIGDQLPSGKMCAQAMVAIVPCYRKESISPQFHDIDLAACTENILLEIETLGLGAVWVGISPIPEKMQVIRKILSIPNYLEPFSLIPIGHKTHQKEQIDRYDETRIHYIK